MTFSYPLTTLNSSYLSYASDDTVTFSDTEMVDLFQRLKDWMSQAPVTVLNPSLAMTELQRQLSGRPRRFPCLAGYKYFYIDWHLNVYRCIYLQKVLGPLEDFAALPRERNECHAWTVDCYRDASVQQYLAVVLGMSGKRRQGKRAQPEVLDASRQRAVPGRRPAEPTLAGSQQSLKAWSRKPVGLELPGMTSASPRLSTAAIVQAHQQGILTSASLMTNGPAWQEA